MLAATVLQTKIHESKQAKDLLKSETWVHVRNGIKYLVSELEIKGKHLAAARVDREYTQLAEALRQAVTQNNPPKIKDDFVLWDIHWATDLHHPKVTVGRGQRTAQLQTDDPGDDGQRLLETFACRKDAGEYASCRHWFGKKPKMLATTT